MEYSGIVMSRDVIGYGIVFTGCLVDSGGVYRTLAEICSDPNLNNNGYIAPVAIVYPNNAVILGLTVAIYDGTGWVYTPIHNVCNQQVYGVSSGVLQLYDLTGQYETLSHLKYALGQDIAYLQNRADLLANPLYYDEFYSGKNINQILADRVANTVYPEQPVTNTVYPEQSTEQPVLETASLAENGVQEEVIPVQAQDAPVQDALVQEQAEAEVITTGQVGAVNFETGMSEHVSDIESSEIVKEIETPETRVPEKALPVELVSVEASPELVEVSTEPIKMDIVEGHTESHTESISTGELMRTLGSEVQYNDEYKKVGFDMAGLSCTLEEAKNHGPKDFKAPLTDVEKYVIKLLSNEIQIQYYEQPFLAYIEKLEDFKSMMYECADVLKHNDTSRIMGRGEQSNVMRAYNQLSSQLYRPTILFPELGDGKVINAAALKAISECTGNMIYDMLSVNSRFIVILLQLGIPLYSSYNKVYFSIYLSRLLHGISQIYSTMANIALNDEEKFQRIFVEGTEEYEQMKAYRVGDLLTDIDGKVMLSYLKTILGIMINEGEDDESEEEPDDGTYQISWTVDHQIAMGAVSFLQNEFMKNKETITELMSVNGGIVMGEDENPRRLFDTVSELVCAYGYSERAMSLPKSELSFAQGLSMPDLKIKCLDTQLDFYYRDKHLLKDVIFYIAYTYNRAVNQGMDDSENSSILDTFWENIDSSPRLKEMLFGLATCTDANGETRFLIDHSKVPAEKSILSVLSYGMDADSVDIFKMICSELYGKFLPGVVTGDIANIDINPDDELEGRRRMNSQEYLGYFKALWEAARGDGNWNVEVTRRLLYSSGKYLSTSMKEVLVRYAYTMYDAQNLGDAVKDVQLCEAISHLLYNLVSGEDEAGSIPKECSSEEQNVREIYARLLNIVPLTFGQEKYSLDRLIRQEKLDKIQHFKTGDNYNMAKRDLVKYTDSDIKRQEYSEGVDLKLINYNVKYNIDYVVEVSAAITIDAATMKAIPNPKKVRQHVVGFVCSNDTNPSASEFIPSLGLKLMNTLAKYQYRFNVAEQVNNLYKVMRSGSNEGQVLLNAFMSNPRVVAFVKKAGLEVNEHNVLEWLNDEIFSVLRTEIDEQLVCGENEMIMNAGVMRRSNLKYEDGSGPVGKLKIKGFNNRYLKYLAFIAKTLDNTPNKTFTIKYLGINPNERHIDKTRNNLEVHRYGVVQKTNPDRLEHMVFAALRTEGGSCTIIKTIQLALMLKTDGEYTTRNTLTLSPLISNGDDLDKNGNPITLWKSLVPTPSVKSGGPNGFTSEQDVISLGLIYIFQYCHAQVITNL